MPELLEMKVPLKIDTKVGKNWGEMEYGDVADVGEMGARGRIPSAKLIAAQCYNARLGE